MSSEQGQQPTKRQLATFQFYQWVLRSLGRPEVPPCALCAKVDKIVHKATNQPDGRRSNG